MRVLLAATNSDAASGATRCLVELAAKLQSKGIYVLVTIPRHGNIEKLLCKNKINYVYIHEYQSWYVTNNGTEKHMYMKRLMNFCTFFKMRKLLKKERIDVVHENAVTAYVAAWAAQSLNIPVVWHIREFMDKDLNIKFFNSEYSLNKINKSKAIIAISKVIKQKWKSVIEPQIEVVNDGVPVEDYFVPIKSIYDSEQVNIILYGRIVRGKGQLFYFKGIKRLVDLGIKNIHAFWAGEIEDKKYYQIIKKYISENSLEGYVTYLGEVEKIKKVLRKMDIVAVCSNSEAFGRVTVEGMMAGCTVIGARSGATDEIIKDKITGYLYSNGNIDSFTTTLSNIISNRIERRGIAKCGQKYAIDNFSINKNVIGILKIYRKVLN